MARRLVSAFLPLVALAVQSAAANAEKLTLERMFAAPDLSGPSLRKPQVSPDGRLVTYLKGKEDAKDTFDLWAYDVRARRHAVLVDSARLVPERRELSAEEEQRRERQRISSLSGIVEYSLSPDGRAVLVPLGGDLYLYDLSAGRARALTQSEAYETDARFSPRGRYVSFVRDQNLWVVEVASGAERPITREGGGPVSFGVAEFIAQEEMDRDTGYWWSPDEERIAFARVDESAVEEVERFEIGARETRVVRQRYPRAGATNARVDLFVAALAGGEPVAVDLGADPDFYLARVAWFPDGRALAVQRQSRDQKQLDLLDADAATGRTRVLLTETSDTWVDLHDELTLLERGSRFIWASTCSGFKHLYLHERDGRLVGPLTGGEWMVVGDGGERAIRGVDETRGLVYFMANRDTPLERHLYVAPLRAGAAPGEQRRITSEPGWHSVQMSRNARAFIDVFSAPDRPPAVTLRDTSGRSLAELVPNRLDASHPYAPFLAEHVSAEFGTLKATDGQTLHYQILALKILEPGKRYPAIVDVYGGPGHQRVRRAWGGSPGRSNEGFFRQLLAQSGYVVFTLDNRGSGFRGVAFERALYGKLGHVEVEDQVRGVELLRGLPYVDPKRIGIFGWSYGGYMALMAAMRAPDVFAAAVSGAPFVDPALYDTHYTERYLGKPRDNASGYAASNVVTHASGLRAPLLVIHGLADDNVLFTHSTALFSRLQALGKPFDVMVYPGAKHGLLRHAETGPHAYATIKRFFDGRVGN
jgi:dipeptidyl-peptidase-4